MARVWTVQRRLGSCYRVPASAAQDVKWGGPPARENCNWLFMAELGIKLASIVLLCTLEMDLKLRKGFLISLSHDRKCELKKVGGNTKGEYFI